MRRGRTCPSDAQIGRYVRVPVEVHEADPRAPEAASCLIALIATKWPGTPAEHVGSSAVAGLAGKNTIDLLLADEPAHIPAITQNLLEPGFQPRGTDLSVQSAADLARIARSLNNRPRKTLGYMTPSERPTELLAHTG
jgi:GrpB-like predicted nucleotidyltransferase (UPF0157 family)